MQPLGQAQGEQGLALAALAQGQPAAGGGGGIDALNTKVGGEIPGAWLQQRIAAGLLAPVCHQGAARALGGVVAPGL